MKKRAIHTCHFWFLDGFIIFINCIITELRSTKTILLLILSLPQMLFTQTRVSLATDASVQRNFKKDQHFWAFGQDVCVNWHFSTKSGAYASVCYYSNGNFKNSLSAIAKLPATSPQQIFFTNRAQVRLKQISFGWRYYLKGTSDADGSWDLYAVGGFGVIFGSASNVYSMALDTSLYNIPQRPVNGSGHFKRLTLDLGLGWETPIAGEIYFYTQGKVWIPTTEYPSRYLFVNNNAPFAGMISAGFRILF